MRCLDKGADNWECSLFPTFIRVPGLDYLLDCQLCSSTCLGIQMNAESKWFYRTGVRREQVAKSLEKRVRIQLRVLAFRKVKSSIEFVAYFLFYLLPSIKNCSKNLRTFVGSRPLRASLYFKFICFLKYKELWSKFSLNLRSKVSFSNAQRDLLIFLATLHLFMCRLKLECLILS